MPSRPDLDVYGQRLTAALDVIENIAAEIARIGVVDGCGRCFTERDLELLGGDPAAIPDDLVERFATKVTDHWDPTQYGLMWRILSPRILRMVAEGRPAVDVSRLLRGPSSAEARFREWPSNHQHALVEAYSALLATAVVTWHPAEVIELLGPLAALHDDVGSWLAQIDAMSGPTAEAGLVRLAAHWSSQIAQNETLDWLWYPDDPAGLATTWLSSHAVTARLTAFLGQQPSCANAAGALRLIDTITTGAEVPWDTVIGMQDCAACAV